MRGRAPFLPQSAAQMLGIFSVVHGRLLTDLPLLQQFEHSLIHGDHSLPAAGSQYTGDLIVLAVPDHGAHGAALPSAYLSSSGDRLLYDI